MPTTMGDVLRKVLDNANLGKAVADVGPGFALSIPLLMLIALITGVSVLPADRLTELRSEIRQAKSELESVKASFKELLAGVVAPDVAAVCDAGNDPAAVKADRCYGLALRTLAELGTDVEAYAAAMKDPVRNRVEIERLTPIRKANDRLLAQKDVLDAAADRLQTLENRRIDYESLQYNLVTFTDNTSVFIAFAVILGILLSQIGHWALVDLVFNNRPAVKKASGTVITIEQLMSKQDAELVTRYYRYAEGAINMIAGSSGGPRLSPMPRAWAIRSVRGISSGAVLVAMAWFSRTDLLTSC
jgi:hypothetical protein